MKDQQTMPGQSYRSKLNPYFEFIREARLREETWEAIAVEISRRGTPADRSQVCKFFQRRVGGKRPAGFAPEPGAGGHAPPDTTPAGAPAFTVPVDGLMETPVRKKLILKIIKNP